MPTAITLEGSDADKRDSLSFIIATLPSNGSLSVGGTAITETPHVLTGDLITYTPDTPFTGADSFRFKVNDGAADSNIATVTIVTVNATLTVTKTEDTNDGICDADCSLREAIIAANAREDADRIRVPAGTYKLSIARFGEDAAETGDLDITDELTINGVGAGSTFIDGGGHDRVFHILAFGRSVDISGVTVQNGDTSGQGGGILSVRGKLTLTDVIVRNNTASSGGGIRALDGDPDMLTMINVTVSGNTGIVGGGGILSDRATLTNVTVSGNSTGGHGGGISGGATLTDSTVSDNTAGSGGGIYNQSGTLSMTNSIVSSNSASDSGGGIYNHFRGTVNITDSTVSDNSASKAGGGIANTGGVVTLAASTITDNTTDGSGGGVHNTHTKMNIANSTISGNTAKDGGGAYNIFGGELTITNSTISNNNAAAEGGGLYNGIASRRGSGGIASLANTIIANNGASTGPDCFGSPTSVGHNLIGNTTGCEFAPASGDLVNVDPLLGPLRDNGGSTLTHGLLPGSPALGAGDDRAAPASDQRGVARPQCGTSDIGAYELEPSGNCFPVAGNQSVNTQKDTAVAITLTGDDADEDTMSFTIVSLPSSGDLFVGSSFLHLHLQNRPPTPWLVTSLPIPPKPALPAPIASPSRSTMVSRTATSLPLWSSYRLSST